MAVAGRREIRSADGPRFAQVLGLKLAEAEATARAGRHHLKRPSACDILRKSAAYPPGYPQQQHPTNQQPATLPSLPSPQQRSTPPQHEQATAPKRE
ncbi:hypothetical protein GCM10027422_28760 [Hymenobacter arcticus]